MSVRMSRKGLSIGISLMDDDVYVELRAIGRLTHRDYEVLVPMLDEAIKEVPEPHIRILVDAREFEGWEPRAAWDDFRLGLKHRKEFSKIAILGNKPWEKYVTTVARWFTSGDARYFEEMDEAIEWIRG